MANFHKIDPAPQVSATKLNNATKKRLRELAGEKMLHVFTSGQVGFWPRHIRWTRAGRVEIKSEDGYPWRDVTGWTATADFKEQWQL